MKPTLMPPVRPNGKLQAAALQQAEIEQLRAQNGHILAMFMALLMEHHKGGVNISLENCNKYQKYGLNYRPLPAPLNDKMRVCVVDPRTNLPISVDDPGTTTAPTEQIGAEAVVPAVVEPEPAPEPEAPPCGGPWHTDPNAMGRRCPECGSAARGV